ASADELLRVLLGDDPGLAPLQWLLIERTEGNPFFLEESMRALVETGVLTGAPGAYRLAQALPTIQVPATVQAVLAARIDRLPPEEKRLLQMAAVIGTEVPLPLLQAIAELPESALHGGLAHLQAAEFLYEARLYPDHEYTFRHALTHEVAYESLLQDRRRALHARIVEALEHLYPDRLPEPPQELPDNAHRGGLWGKPVTYFRQAGVRAFSRCAMGESVPCFAKALEALEHLPESRESMEQALDIRFDLRLSLYTLGQLDKMLENLEKAQLLAGTLADPGRLARVSAAMSAVLSLSGKATEALQFAERTQAIAETLGDAELQREANFLVGMICAQSGAYRRAKDLLLPIVRSLEGERIRRSHGYIVMIAPLAVLSRMWLVWALAGMGEFDAGLAHGQDGLRIAEELDHPYSLIYACSNLAYLSGVKGDLSDAVRLLERARLVSQSVNLPAMSTYVTALQGYM